MAQRTVWPDRVVVDAPLFNEHLCFSQRILGLARCGTFAEKVSHRNAPRGSAVFGECAHEVMFREDPEKVPFVVEDHERADPLSVSR